MNLGRLILNLMVGVTLTSCEIHEFPTQGSPAEPDVATVKTLLSFREDETIEFYKQVDDTNTRSVDSKSMGVYSRRDIVNIYRGREADFSIDTQPAYTFTYVRPEAEEPEFSEYVELPEGDYTCVAFGDFTTGDDSFRDLYYSTGDFHEVILSDKNNHVANIPYRAAYRGLKEFSVTAGEQRVEIELLPIEARYDIIATDYDEFEEYARAMMQKKQEAAGTTEGVKNTPITLDDYKIVVRYSGYMPCSFNMLANRPADSWTGVWYEGASEELSTSEVQLASDYIFVNESESWVSIYLEVEDVDGDVISRSSSIDIPLLRGHYTTVRGRFLTTKSSGGAKINPAFDGEYNIQID